MIETIRNGWADEGWRFDATLSTASAPAVCNAVTFPDVEDQTWPKHPRHPRHLEWNLANKLSVRSLCPWTGGNFCVCPGCSTMFHCFNNWEESKIIKDHLSNQACQAGQKRSHRCRAQAKMLKAPHLGSRKCASWWFERFPEVESYKINWIPMTPMTDWIKC